MRTRWCLGAAAPVGLVRALSASPGGPSALSPASTGVGPTGGALPAAAARRHEINALRADLARLLSEEPREHGAIRAVRKALGRLHSVRPYDDFRPAAHNNTPAAPAHQAQVRAPPPPTEVRVATFFAFRAPDDPIDRCEARAARLWTRLDALRSVLGSVAVAPEGVNGGLSLAAGTEDAVVAAFKEELGIEVTLNVAPLPTAGAPHLALHVKAKRKALADGGIALDWTDCGDAVDAATWHAALSETRNNNTARSPGRGVVLDVRNAYESAKGRFEGSTPLDTATFGETFDRLDDVLRDADRAEPVYMYCTGGVRCVKAGAYVKQRLGFATVKRLQDGIVGYERWFAANTTSTSMHEEESSRFVGRNFVFDRRRFADSPVEWETCDDTPASSSSV